MSATLFSFDAMNKNGPGGEWNYLINKQEMEVESL